MMTLEDSVEIQTMPEHVFNWFTNLRTKENYRAWHPDHVKWQWVKGEPFQKGSIVLCEEYIHGKLHRLKFVCSDVVPNRLIEYKPTFPMSILMSKSQFIIEPKGEKSCVLTAAISFREGPFFKKLFNKRMEDLKQHMKAEGENLKKILESTGSS